MPIEQLNSFVFVGQFPFGFIDERELFGGNVDPESVAKINPIIQCTYLSGKFHFSATPNRIDVGADEDSIVSEELEAAANSVAKKIDELRSFVSVKGMGLNCDVVFGQDSIGMSGVDYCAKLMSLGFANLIGASDIQSKCGFAFTANSLNFEVRFEPHVNSKGEQLFVAVNGHQSVSGNETLDRKFSSVSEFRDYVEALHRRIGEQREKSSDNAT